MRVLLQRVTSCSVSIDGKTVATIGKGLLCLCGITTTDKQPDMDWMSGKILSTRLWESNSKKPWQESVNSLNCEVMIVSQFTLHGVLKGNKPDFHASMNPTDADIFFNAFVQQVQTKHPGGASKVGVGVFGADMAVSLVNDGPVTLMLDTDEAGFKKTKKFQQQAAYDLKQSQETNGETVSVNNSVGSGGASMSKKQAKREKRRLEKAAKIAAYKAAETRSETKTQTTPTIQASDAQYSIIDPPEMIPIGFDGMVNDATNHR